MKIIIFILILAAVICPAQTFKIPEIPFNPPKYICIKAVNQIKVDGLIEENEWSSTPWSSNFVDIKGRKDCIPAFSTRIKMLWDNKNLYVAAELKENDIWGTVEVHDDTIYNNNNFEVFLDPDGDTHNYFELELNALNTTWDLLMIKPYRDMEKASLSGWELRDMKTGIKIYGTINKPGDIDSCWTIEAAFPWQSLKEISSANMPPETGDQWRINFARAEWSVRVQDNSYAKLYDSLSGKPLRSFSSWAPQGLVNLHYPEMWGYVQFDTSTSTYSYSQFIDKEEEIVKWYLRKLYYAEKQYYEKHNNYTEDLSSLAADKIKISGFKDTPGIETMFGTFSIILYSEDGKMTVSISEDGRITSTQNKTKP